MITVYAGGAIDYAEVNTDAWRHELPGLVYCPQCENRGVADPEEIIARNTTALLEADVGVFLLSGQFTVGTPVEIHQRMEVKPETTIIVHPGPIGVFVHVWHLRGAFVVRSLPSAAVRVEMLARVIAHNIARAEQPL